MFRQLAQLILAHYREFLREPGIIFWSIIFPVGMAWGLGIAFTEKHDKFYRMAVVDERQKTDSISAFMAVIQQYGKPNTEEKAYKNTFLLKMPDSTLGNTTVNVIRATMPEALKMLKKGKISIIAKEGENGISYLFDPANTDAQLQYTNITAYIQNPSVVPDRSNVSVLTLTGTRYIDFLIPGLIAMGVMMSCMWGVSYGLIDKRAKKLLRRMVATPMSKGNFMASVWMSRATLTVIDAIILIVFSHFYFGSEIQGSLSAFFAVFIAGNVCFIGLAVLTASRTANTEIGNGLINAIVTPMMIVSGIFFSYHNFPDWIAQIIQYLPLTILADSIRSIFNEGAGLADVALPILILSSAGLVFFLTGIRIYKWY